MKIGWNVLPPLTFVAIVGAWSLAVRVFKIPAYLLPGPGPVFARLITDASMLWGNAMVTLTEIVLGFGLTLLSAIPLGLLIALSPVARQILYPPIVLLQLVPKIAVAPLFLVWLGFGIESKVRHRRRRASDVQAERAKPPPMAGQKSAVRQLLGRHPAHKEGRDAVDLDIRALANLAPNLRPSSFTERLTRL